MAQFDLVDFEIDEEAVKAAANEISQTSGKTDEQDEQEEEEIVDDQTNNSDTSSTDDPLTLFHKELFVPLGLLDEDVTWKDEADFAEKLQEKYISNVDEASDRKIKSFGENDPAYLDLFEFKKNGGRVEDFINEMYLKDDYTYTEEQITENEDLQKGIVSDYLVAKKLVSTQKELDDEIEEMNSTGTLEKKALKFVQTLKAGREQEKTELINRQQKLHENAVKELQAENTSVQKILDTRAEIGGLKISKKDREDLKNYLYGKDKDGITPRQKKLKEIETKVKAKDASVLELKVLAMLAEMKDYNLGEVEAVKAKKTLKEQLSNTTVKGMNFNKTAGSGDNLPQKFSFK